MDNVDISGLDKGDVLRALYNRARPQGMGFLHYDSLAMTRFEATGIIGARRRDGDPLHFDYLKGRVMKVDISGDVFSPRLYDRDNGAGAAEETIRTLRETGDPVHRSIIEAHRANAMTSAVETMHHAGTPTDVVAADETVELHLGMPAEAGAHAVRALEEL